MKKVVKYRLVEVQPYEKKSIEKIINDLIKEGWQPQGGICFNYLELPNDDIESGYTQAMVKYEV